MEDGVARLLRIVRSHLYTLHKCGIVPIEFVAPVSTLVVASVYINCRVVRLYDSQIQTVELQHMTRRSIKECIRVDTGRSILLTGLLPYVRIFLIRMGLGSRVNLTDRYLFAVLGNDA